MNVAEELEAARQKLLDLTLRNRLLNHRPSAARTIRVLSESPADVYDALVVREKALEFRGGNRAASHGDRWLETPYDDEALGRKLFRIYHEGRSAHEEQGYTVTHLALGFLEWTESDHADQAHRAPLILVPAELDRVRASDFSKVRWTGEDVFANISLQAKLADLGVRLPPFDAPEEKDGIDAWLAQVAAAIGAKSRWRVVPELMLDFFSFTKFVMFKDLDASTWPDDRKPHDHPLLRTLFAPDAAGDNGSVDEKDLDETLTARDVWHVMDADPSQMAVIEEAKRGRNLVVQGPPGTGKSQTIANLIAEALAAGKCVLFVSEKMAALEVVKARLDDAGLGPFCLELHSRKANKKTVLLEIEQALGSRPAAFDADVLLDEHELLKRDLNQYARQLATPVGALGRSPYQLLGMRQTAMTQLADIAIELPQIDNARGVAEGDLLTAEKALREIAYVVPLVAPVTSHPWRASSRESMLPHEQEEVRAILQHARDAVAEAIGAAAALVRDAGVRQPARLADVDTALHSAELLARADAPTETSLLLSDDWNAPNAQAEALIGRVEAFHRDRKELARTFADIALDGNHAAEISELTTRSTGFFRIFDGRYRQLHREIKQLYRAVPPRKTPQLCADLARLVELQAVRDALRGHARGAALFGARWKADRSDCAALRAFTEWLVAFRRELLEQALTKRAVDIANGRVDSDAIRTSATRLRNAADALRSRLCDVAGAVRVDVDVTSIAFDELAALLSRWIEQLPDLFRWCRFNAARAGVRATVAAAVEPLIAGGALDAERGIPFFRGALAESLLRIAFAERDALGRFAGDLHEKKIARFRDLDRQLISLNRARLSQRLHAARPQIGGGASPHSEVGILLGEMHRKRGHMAIRKLLAKAGGVIQRVKPCFLMSPLSIAQFLDPHSARFDLIVFDEASQVRPEDAVGALLRGSQLIVMGDTQQLPPTSFFDHLGDDVTDDDEESVALKDVESILHQCARSYPTKMLEWHYRSRHQSLIATSNLHFYDNRLRIYPSAIDWADDLGLHFVHVAHGVYDRGRSGVNRVEAEIVAAAAIAHCRRHPEKSLGIGTFNVKQQQAIQEEIELQLQRNPDMEPLFKRDRREPFFVKNLETIQGDERDTILISLGYGRDAAGKLSLNFGPLNQEGGERRLNVLISRARERCVVYSNFTAADLPRDAAKGVSALRSFLEYAQSRRLAGDAVAVDEDASPFEDAVAAVLREEGHEVRQRVGCAGFRVDVAVVDPENRGRYRLAVECDGAKYHEARVARDRDRLRHQMLVALGWRVHRVWSTDWYRNRAETVARLLDAVKSPPSECGGSPPLSLIVDPPQPVVARSEEIPMYEPCRTLRIPTAGELHLVPPEMLALAVEDVVAVEGPVHADEVVRRIRTIWGLQRAGNRIREAIERGIRIAVARRVVASDGDFLHVPNAAVRLRRRNGDPPPRIELIAEPEIAEALRHVLRSQFATPRADLIDATARRFGIQATSAGIAARIGEVVDREVARGALAMSEDVVRLA